MTLVVVVVVVIGAGATPVVRRFTTLVLVVARGVAVARGPQLAQRLKRAKEVIADRRIEEK